MGLLRFLLAIAVLARHPGPVLGLNLGDGRIAVQSFFMISGFHMALVLNEKYVPPQSTYALFLGNRALRLFPAYLLVLFLTLAAFVTGLWTPAGNFGFATASGHALLPPLTWLVIGLSNLLILGQDLFMFLGISPGDGHLQFTAHYKTASPAPWQFLLIPQAWSVSIELMFYAVAPFLVRRRPNIILAIMLASLGVRILMYAKFHLYRDPWSDRFFPSEIFFFMAGALGYRAYLKTSDCGNAHRPLLWALWMLVILTLLFITRLGDLWAGLVVYPLIAVSIPLLFTLTRGFRLDRMIGEL
jgi:peptidoglycan/LPS O-acetylase OafA/YrhL